MFISNRYTVSEIETLSKVKNFCLNHEQVFEPKGCLYLAQISNLKLFVFDPHMTH